jgi:N-acetylated-alpha-linked acidic dipeptidase
LRSAFRPVLALCCLASFGLTQAGVATAQTAPAPSAHPQTVSSDTALVGWAAGKDVTDELAVEQTLMGVPSASNAMDIERHISSLPHRATTEQDYATAQYVKARLDQDGFATRIQEYDVEFTGPLSQSLELVSPRHAWFDLLEGTPGAHTKWEMLAGPPFLEESGDGDVTGPLVYVNGASKDDMAELDALHINLQGAIALVRTSAGGAPGRFDPSYIAYNELRKRGVAGILIFMEPGTTGYGGGAMWPDGNFKNTNMAERFSGLSPRVGFLSAPGDPTIPGHAPIA